MRPATQFIGAAMFVLENSECEKHRPGKIVIFTAAQPSAGYSKQTATLAVGL
jgi:hypothetical protein